MKECAEVATSLSGILLSCLGVLVLFVARTVVAQDFSCPNGQIDVMKYFVLSQRERDNYFLDGSPTSVYTEVHPNRDFAPAGYWFWLKSSSAQGFDVKACDSNYIYMRSTELNWGDNSTFKRFVHDLGALCPCRETRAASRGSRYDLQVLRPV